MRILLIANFPRRRELGAARIHIEFAEALREIGNEVEEIFYDDIFPRPCAKALEPFRRTKRDFADIVHRIIRERGRSFDVIDATEACLFLPARTLGFGGLLVTRSAGLSGLYAKVLGKVIEPQAVRDLRNLVGNLLRKVGRWREGEIGRESFAAADLVNVVNDEEEQFLRNEWGLTNEIVKLPYGIDDTRRQRLREGAASAAERLAAATVVLVGTWQPRKGSRDLAAIIRQVRTHVPQARFLLLGTGVSRDVVCGEIGPEADRLVEVVPYFESDQLPALLRTSTVGIFPSYVESFGFAVLEKLASGLPTVAYRCPGPPVMLRHCEAGCLVAPGDTRALAEEVVRRLKFSVEEYQAAAEGSLRAAEQFAWRDVARATCEIYRRKLDEVQRSHSDMSPAPSLSRATA